MPSPLTEQYYPQLRHVLKLGDSMYIRQVADKMGLSSVVTDNLIEDPEFRQRVISKINARMLRNVV